MRNKQKQDKDNAFELRNERVNKKIEEMVNDRNARNDSRRKHWFETVDNGNSKLYGGIESLRSSLEEKYSKRDQHLEEKGQKLQNDLNKKKRDKDKKVSETL